MTDKPAQIDDSKSASNLAAKVLDKADPQESGCILYRGKMPILEAQGAVYLAVGRHVPAGMYATSKCGSARCVNPEHMKLALSTGALSSVEVPHTPAPVAPPIPIRRRRMKSDIEIRNQVIMIIRAQAQNPVAMVHLLTGYVRELQDLMKRDREDELSEKVCEHRHPGRLSQGLYCRLCHDAEMAGKFGSLPTAPHPSGDLLFEGDAENQASAEAGASNVDLMLGDIKIKTE